ncbi:MULTISPECIES: OmpP1/FadL family transporter [Roseovarius]|uniref:OmpP1/FadL family transporter n=1 Tax=Roseovarius TaxID=74030 RepID=UPI001C93BE83|nr:outer membrane protein transport protein [Roseovarius atlanticus]MBY5988735.1 outer membrane protein transport protein [Roseovarius atlanticus]MBY6124126.1 outer membrane protein transport protein [Roseovarius atlanticus]MBY6148621.1 outer membrane protein transport protein [Roseovarius atlanticus]
MKNLALAACALTATASAASAGQIERRGDPSQILFEEGRNYLQFSVATVHPNVSGPPIGTAAAIGATPTGNIQNSYESYALGFKHQFNDRLALAFVIDEPVGASVNYRTAPYTGPGTGAFFGASNAEVSSIQFTAMAKYEVVDNISVYGGVRYQGLKGDITVISPATGPAGGPGPYTLSVDNDFQLGYLVGAAYERPELAMRFALTYESKIEHSFRDNNGTPFDVEIPQAVTLHARSGIAPDTLLFGSIKWREWTAFNVQPADFFSYTPAPVNTSIASGTSDIWTYELGLGRRFSENWSGAAIIGYEKDNGDVVGNLSGTDGYVSYGLAVTYETESWEITSGIRYIDVGSANSSVTGFTGSDAIAVGTQVGFKF